MYDREWLHDFALATRYTTLALAVQNSCILSTRVGLDVLHRFGVDAKAQPVAASAYNREGYRWAYIEKRPVSEWPDNAWAVGVGGTGKTDPETKAWDGHLVLLLRAPDRTRTLIDLTADQMDRPERGIDIGGPVFMDIAPGTAWTPRDPLSTWMGSDPATAATIVSYRPLVKAGDWQSTPDWVRPVGSLLVENGNGTEGAEAMIVRLLTEKHGGGPKILESQEASR